jgi:hypothetical protein
VLDRGNVGRALGGGVDGVAEGNRRAGHRLRQGDPSESGSSNVSVAAERDTQCMTPRTTTVPEPLDEGVLTIFVDGSMRESPRRGGIGIRFVSACAPTHTDTFRTDLASIPFFATWLVPRDGKHTPAALLHDSLYADARGLDSKKIRYERSNKRTGSSVARWMSPVFPCFGGG